MGFLAVILVLLAIWSFFVAAKPEVGFFLEEGWKFRDAEPSDLYLGLTRISAAIAGIGCLVIAAVLAFGGPAGPTEPGRQAGTDSTPTTTPNPDGRTPSPITVTASPRNNAAEAARHAKDDCKRLKPRFEEEASWDAQGNLANREALTSLAAYELAELVIEQRADGQIVSVRSESASRGTAGRILFTLTSSGATCTP